MSQLWFVVDELHIQWEIILEGGNITLSTCVDAALEKHGGLSTAAVESAANQQVYTFDTLALLLCFVATFITQWLNKQLLYFCLIRHFSEIDVTHCMHGTRKGAAAVL